MVDKKGTGDVLGRIDLGEIGTLVIVDDGDQDTYVRERIEHDGGESTVLQRFRSMRSEKGDEWIMEQLSRGEARGVQSDSLGSMQFEPDVFVCHNCSRTWPGDANETPNASVDTCPKCGGGQ